MDQSSTFEEQLAAVLPRLRRFAHALSRNPADADDLTQATIERALKRAGSGSRALGWTAGPTGSCATCGSTPRGRGREEPPAKRPRKRA